jgi:hypothetical protein
MALEDILKFRLKRINPFQGLVIDADTWRDAHDYHRDLQRLHLLTLHKTGIVDGLEVTANNPPDYSVTIHPGVAIDPEGNVIIVPQAQNYQVQTRKKGIVYLVIQFREIPAEPYQPPDGGQPTRILEGYRIQEREEKPDEPHLELARIDIDATEASIKDAKRHSQPSKNEINLTFRREVKPEALPVKIQTAPEEIRATALEISRPQATVIIGHAVLGEAGKDLHIAGLQNLIREINRQYDFTVNLKENITLDKDISHYNLIYLTGFSQFDLTAEQQTALSAFLESGGIIFGEGCSEGQDEDRVKGAKEFGLAFNQLASQLKCKLEMVQRGHSLLEAVHVFSEVPPGTAPAMLLEGNNMVYSASDYGCAWQGGHKNAPLSRDIIRSSFEMGTNIIAYAYRKG